jgi:hypothetical protein
MGGRRKEDLPVSLQDVRLDLEDPALAGLERYIGVGVFISDLVITITVLVSTGVDGVGSGGFIGVVAIVAFRFSETVMERSSGKDIDSSHLDRFSEKY